MFRQVAYNKRTSSFSQLADCFFDRPPSILPQGFFSLKFFYLRILLVSGQSRSCIVVCSEDDRKQSAVSKNRGGRAGCKVNQYYASTIVQCSNDASPLIPMTDPAKNPPIAVFKLSSFSRRLADANRVNSYVPPIAAIEQ